MKQRSLGRGAALFIVSILMCSLLPSAVSARDDLKLTIVNNSTTSDLNVVVKGSSSKHDEVIGLVPKGGTSSPYPIPVTNDAVLTVVASMPDGGFQVDSETVGVRDRYSFTQPVTVRAGVPLTDDGVQTLITDITKAQGTTAIQLGTAPYDGAINTMMGELIEYDAANPNNDPLLTLPPSTFVSTPLTKADMDLAGTFSLNNTVKVSSTASAKINGTIPAIVALGATFASGNAYELSYSLNTAGPILPKTGHLPDLYDALAKIPADKVKFMCNAGKTVKQPKLFYITQMWGVGGGSMDEKTAKTADASITATGNVFVDGNAAYDFSDAEDHLITVTGTMLNYGGNNVDLSVLCTPDTIVTTAATIQTTSGGTGSSGGVSASGSGTSGGHAQPGASVALSPGVYSASTLRSLSASLDSISAGGSQGVAAKRRSVSVSRYVGLYQRYQAAKIGEGFLPAGPTRVAAKAVATPKP
jgi:hypothetical protein